MNNPLQVGITGGIGSGKSIICRIFSLLGIPVYDADTRAKNLMTRDDQLVRGVRDLFGEEAYLQGELNRSYIASRTFNDEGMTRKLNELVHPAVGRDYSHWMREQEAPYLIKEAALLIESGSYKSLDVLVNVHAPAAMRLERVLKRDPDRSVKQIRNIMSRQLSDEERMKKSDHTIYNDGSCLVIPQVMKLDKLFRKDRVG